jgi:Cys-rich four helix bundle protein (predicted Tat secretion target)
MNRRDFVTTSALAAAAAALNPAKAFAADAAPSLTETAAHCVAKGNLCQQHCIESLSTGSKMMAECADKVRDMLIYCDALSKAAAAKSPHLKALAKIARDACLDCETACRKHQKMDVCKACADACADCAKACSSA